MTEKEYEELLSRILKGKKRNIPKRQTDKSIDRIIKTYAEGYKDVYTLLINNLTGIGTDTSATAQASILLQLEEQLTILNNKVSKELQEALAEAYVEGNAMHALATETVKSVEELKIIVPYSLVNHEKIYQASIDTFEDLLFVTQHTTKESKKIIREVFSKHIQLGVATNQGHASIIHRIKKELERKNIERLVADKALVGIIDSRGRRWKLNHYVNIVTKTKLQQIHVEGLKDRANETGYDLALIPDMGARDSCRNFEGLVISLTGKSKGYMTYDSLRATGLIFHPQCRHTPVPIRKFDLLHDDEIAIHKKMTENLKNIK